jgi:hypothetical protein
MPLTLNLQDLDLEHIVKHHNHKSQKFCDTRQVQIIAAHAHTVKPISGQQRRFHKHYLIPTISIPSNIGLSHNYLPFYSLN